MDWAGAPVCADLGTAAAFVDALGSPDDVIERGGCGAPDTGGRRFCSRGIRLPSDPLFALANQSFG